MLDHNEDENVADWTLDAFLGGITQDKLDKTSAVNYITKDTPPFMTLHGSADTTVAMVNSEKLYDRLTECGVPAEFYVLDGAVHGDDMFYQEPVLDAIDCFLKHHMG